MAENNMNGKDFLIGALIGGIIGAGAALLLAPKSGRELRVNISDGYQTAAKKTQEIAKTVTEQTGSLVDKVKVVAGNVKEDVAKWTNKSDKDIDVEDDNLAVGEVATATEIGAAAEEKV